MKTGTACGKIILSGEYAVVFGLPGVAVPLSLRTQVTWEEREEPLQIYFEGNRPSAKGEDYVRAIIALFEQERGPVRGSLTIHTTIPLGKGLGSSTSLVIALCRTILGPEREEVARHVEDTVNPGHSGIDFAVIWNEHPLLFAKGTSPEQVKLSLPKDALLLDTGTPNQTTAELVAWVKERQKELDPHLQSIAWCTQRLLAGDLFRDIVRDHHRAQVGLGVVPNAVQECVAEIEEKRGAAKVLGAGARTGGGGMVLVVGLPSTTVKEVAAKHHYSILSLPS